MHLNHLVLFFYSTVTDGNDEFTGASYIFKGNLFIRDTFTNQKSNKIHGTPNVL